MTQSVAGSENIMQQRVYEKTLIKLKMNVACSINSFCRTGKAFLRHTVIPSMDNIYV